MWGDEDVFGTLNLQTPERALAAVDSVQTGCWFPLNLDLELPDPPLFGRSSFRHEVTGESGGIHDDIYHGWNTQRSGQWDGFRHFPHREHGYYNGVADEDHGIQHWAQKGIVARAVLADIARWREAVGRPLAQGEADPISPGDLTSCLEDQGSLVRTGDVLLVRTGWLTWYLSLAPEQRRAHATEPRQPGLAGTGFPRLLWNMHVSAVAADNGAVEMIPMARDTGFLHVDLLPLLGIPLGEMWNLDGLADACAEDRRYDCLLVSAPLNLRSGVASPPNAIALR